MIEVSYYPVVDLVLHYSNPIVVDHFLFLVPFRKNCNLNLCYDQVGHYAFLLAVLDYNFEYEVSTRRRAFSLLTGVAANVIDHDFCGGSL